MDNLYTDLINYVLCTLLEDQEIVNLFRCNQIAPKIKYCLRHYVEFPIYSARYSELHKLLTKYKHKYKNKLFRDMIEPIYLTGNPDFGRKCTVTISRNGEFMSNYYSKLPEPDLNLMPPIIKSTYGEKGSKKIKPHIFCNLINKLFIKTIDEYNTFLNNLDKYNKVRYLYFDNKFNHLIKIPNFITHIVFGNYFNQPIIFGIPNSVIDIRFGYFFDQPLKIPNDFSSNPNKNQFSVLLPDSLKFLTLYNYQKPLCVPNTINLKYIDQYGKYTDMPPNICTQVNPLGNTCTQVNPLGNTCTQVNPLGIRQYDAASACA
jgi:hypothetical protein